MNISTIKARDLNEAFFLCCREVLTKGYEYTIDHGSFEGTKRKELDFITLQIEHPGLRPLAPTVPDGIPAPTTDVVIEEYFMNYLLNPEKAKNEQYKYSEYLHEQIETVIKRYKNEGYENNQLTMMVGDKNSLCLDDPPCLRILDTRIRYGKLHFIIYFRSWDIWAGLPCNLGGLQLLKEYMAEAIGVEDGEMIACSKGLHLYDYTWPLARTLCNMGDKC